MVNTIFRDFFVQLAVDVTRWAGSTFFHREPLRLPAEMHYVDLQQRTCQAANHVASTYWNRRISGFVSALVSSAALGIRAVFINSAKSSPSTSVGANHQVGKLVCVAAGIGFATSFALGTYDLIQQSLKERSSAADAKPVFTNELQEQIDALIDITTAPHGEENLYPSVLFVGPPGTGKTMLSKWIAKHSNMNYVYLSGPKLLDKTKTDHHTNALENLVNHAKELPSGAIIFIDEAQSFCEDRKANKNIEGAQLLDALRDLTGAFGKKVMFILATNSTETMDTAILNRMWVISIPLPDLETRKKIIQMHLPLFFDEKTRKTIFTETIVAQIAAKTDSLSGRSLLKLMHWLSLRSRREPLSSDVISNAVQSYLKQ